MRVRTTYVTCIHPWFHACTNLGSSCGRLVGAAYSGHVHLVANTYAKINMCAHIQFYCATLTYIQTCIHPYTRKYMHKHMHTYTHTCIVSLLHTCRASCVHANFFGCENPHVSLDTTWVPLAEHKTAQV